VIIQLTGLLRDQGRNERKTKQLFSPKRAEQLCGPPVIYSKGIGVFRRVKRPGRESNASVPPLSRLRFSAAKRPHKAWRLRHHYCSLYSEVYKEKERIKCNSTVVIRVTCSWEQLFV
jgi:hypothetical protein